MSACLEGGGRCREQVNLLLLFYLEPLFVNALNLGSCSLGHPVSLVPRTWEQYAGRNACSSSQVQSGQGSHFRNHRDHAPELSHPWTTANALPSESGAPLQYHCCGVLWGVHESSFISPLPLDSLPKLTCPTQEGHVSLEFPNSTLFWPSIHSPGTIVPGEYISLP